MEIIGFSPSNGVQPLFQFFFRILARRIEGRGIRIAEPRYLETTHFQVPAMKIMQAELSAEVRDLLRGFVIARNHVHLAGAPLQDLAHRVEMPPPVHQIAGAEVIIGLDGHQAC